MRIYMTAKFLQWADRLKRCAVGAIILTVLYTYFVSMSAFAEDGMCRELSDFSGKTFGMLSGSSFDGLIPKNKAFTDHERCLYFNSDVDSTSALRSGKIDAVTLDRPVAEMVVSQHDDIMIFPEPLAEEVYGFGFKKGSELIPAFNEAMSRLKAEGLDDELKKRWMGTDESAKVLITQDWEAENGTLRYWVNTGTPPMSYIGPDGTPVGYTIDLVLHVAREMGCGVEITECALDGLIPALQSGKADLAGRSMAITEERKKSIDFSDPFYEGAAVLVVRKADVDPSLIPGSATETEEEVSEKKSGFRAGLARDFQSTFITESRWKLILSGLGVTLMISISAVILGTLLGFVLYILLRSRPKIRSVVDFIAGLIVGIPVVVFLMIIYYIIFGSSLIGGIPISIIAFTITFGISVYRMIETGSAAVDPGQMEGALALGYTDRQTFSDIILPQAVLYIFPIYKAELGTLLKATAIVGYIAVQDLTRMGDLIRSRTFAAFFPLIAVAVIYYLLGKLLALTADLLQHCIDPLRRRPERILKGVKEDD